MAALPVGHPLTRREKLRCRDLDGEPIPQWPQTTPAERAFWSGRDRDGARNHSDPPDAERAETGPAVSDPSQLIEVVALGQAVALIPRTLAEGNPRAGIAYRPVTDASPYTIVVAWSEGSRAPHVGQFVRTATDLYLSETAAS